ncbi:MAG: hypothetical protein AAGU74_12865 [Bacillota bacterium]
MKRFGLAVLGLCVVCLLAGCRPFVAKAECASIDEIKAQLDFPIVLPEFVGKLSEQDYAIAYYVTRAAKSGKLPETATGYCVEMSSKSLSCTGYEMIEICGASVEREGDAAQPYNFAATYSNAYVQVKKDTAASLDDREVVYSAYKTFSDEDVQKQKGVADSASGPEDASFDTFYAFTVIGDIRYSIVIHGLVEEAPDAMETRGLAIARQIFHSLFA